MRNTTAVLIISALTSCSAGMVGQEPDQSAAWVIPLAERLEETLQALQVVEHRSRGEIGPPWPTPRICTLVQNGGEELEQDGLLSLFPPAAQDGIVRRYTFTQVEMEGWIEQAPEEPEPIATDPDQGQVVDATLSDIQDENATIIAGLADAEQEVSHETLLCMSELAFRATPAVAYDMADQYSGEALACMVKCLRQANAQAAQICLTVPEWFVGNAEDTEPALVQYLESSCPPSTPETPCPFQ